MEACRCKTVPHLLPMPVKRRYCTPKEDTHGGKRQALSQLLSALDMYFSVKIPSTSSKTDCTSILVVHCSSPTSSHSRKKKRRVKVHFLIMPIFSPCIGHVSLFFFSFFSSFLVSHSPPFVFVLFIFLKKFCPFLVTIELQQSTCYI
uniref:Uncharacterized protein n=1 Tax=Trypanosoma congolense (strain IL3000) TaxID=1068625 RepID=G0UKU1_TRYCI|nr:hypothetical protein, unlikely [Trypanosoma congolense IL3000]